MRKRLTTETFIEKSMNIHGDTYIYNKTKFNKSSEKVCITCRIHGDFWQKPHSHLSGCGCPKCGDSKKNLNKKFTTEKMVEKAKEIHGETYIYDKTTYENMCEKVCITCRIHGDFWQTPHEHLSGCGCPKCAHNKLWDKRGRITTEEFIEKSRKIHGDDYDYSQSEYKNSRTKVKIICHKNFKNGTEHGVFYQKAGSHLNGHGCPHCRSSKLENQMFRLLTENKIEFEKEKTYDWLVKDGHMYLDFYLPKYNVAIECQGIQHYADIEIRGVNRYKEIHDNDLLKNKLCKENGIKIFYFTDKNMYNNYCKNKESTYYNFDSMINDIKR